VFSDIEALCDCLAHSRILKVSRQMLRRLYVS